MHLLRRLVAVVTTTVVAGLVFAAPAQADYEPLVSGHRGTIVGAPESTRAAFEYANKVGADIVELDVWWTKDNWMVVIHDRTLDRTTNCTGLVSDKTLAELKKCDAGNGQKVPTFGEILRYSKKVGLRTNAEVKGPITKARAKHYIFALKKYGMYNRNVMSSNSPTVVRTFKSIDPKLSTAAIAYADISDPAAVKQWGNTYMPTWQYVDRADVESLKRIGVTTYIWPIKTKADFEKAYATRAGVLVTDDPKSVVKWLAAK